MNSSYCMQFAVGSLSSKGKDVCWCTVDLTCLRHAAKLMMNPTTQVLARRRLSRSRKSLKETAYGRGIRGILAGSVQETGKAKPRRLDIYQQAGIVDSANYFVFVFMIPNSQYMPSTTLLHDKWTWIYVGGAFSCRKIWWRFLELWPKHVQTNALRS